MTAHAALLLSLVLADAPVPPQESRRTTSANARYTVQLVRTGPDQCELTVKDNEKPAWSLGECFGGPEDLYFVSDRGDRFWVLHALPPTPKGKAGAVGAGDVIVAALYERTGQRLRVVRLKDLVPRPERGKLQEAGPRFKWLGGVVGVPGVPPHTRAGNQVELETVQPRTYRLDF